jgi:hypothetical protein
MEKQDRDAKRSVRGTVEVSHKKQIRNSILLATVLTAVFLVLYLTRTTSPEKAVTDGHAMKVVIQIDGKRVHTMELDKDAEYRAETADGNYNTVVVKDQSVRVEEADCKNQICVKTGAIHFPGEVIACMPHRMMIYIE